MHQLQSICRMIFSLKLLNEGLKVWKYDGKVIRIHGGGIGYIETAKVVRRFAQILQSSNQLLHNFGGTRHFCQTFDHLYLLFPFERIIVLGSRYTKYAPDLVDKWNLKFRNETMITTLQLHKNNLLDYFFLLISDFCDRFFIPKQLFITWRLFHLGQSIHKAVNHRVVSHRFTFNSHHPNSREVIVLCELLFIFYDKLLFL